LDLKETSGYCNWNGLLVSVGFKSSR